MKGERKRERNLEKEGDMTITEKTSDIKKVKEEKDGK